MLTCIGDYRKNFSYYQNPKFPCQKIKAAVVANVYILTEACGVFKLVAMLHNTA